MLFGVFLGVSLLKFGNPAIFNHFFTWPTNGFEWVFNSWPLQAGYWILGITAFAGLFAMQLKSRVPGWVVAMPSVWLLWQFISATRTVDPELTRPTLVYFAACVVCFYLGLFCLNDNRLHRGLWFPLVLAFAWVISTGIQQHFGGLEETRRYFFAYIYPKLDSVPPEYMKKMSSNRIFSTLFYPNTLAGALLLLLPAISAALWRLSVRLTNPARWFLIGLFGLGGLGCLYWSGSKGGWLLALLMGLVTLLHLSFSKRIKMAVVAVFLLAGVTGFIWKYAGFFEKGATSVHARFDYWRAALQTTVANPVLGTGPATFGVSYKRIKKPESEMARLAHNDYLEQASDSGAVGFVSYLAFVVAVLWFGYAAPKGSADWLRFCVWLGLLGWALQGLFEFGLYVPAIGWTAFALSGWLLGSTTKRIDNHPKAPLG